MVLLDRERRTYRGNLHLHSTRSDGAYAPGDAVRAYRARGYDFVCLSDHEVYFNADAYDRPDFLVLAGYEMACEMSRRETGQQYHVHGLLDPSLRPARPFNHDEAHAKPAYRNLATVQAMIDEMHRRGNALVMNHPDWSRNRFEDLLHLDGYFAIEIYNHQCEVAEASGYALSWWDYLLQRGRRVFGVAADDAHRGPMDTAVSEFFGGWVGVQAERFDQREIVRALVEGRSYSSQGPEIHDLRVEDGELRVQCSPVRFIRFIPYPAVGRSFSNPDGSPLETARYRLQGDELYVRVECVDADGRVAWSNPVFGADLPPDEARASAKEGRTE